MTEREKIIGVIEKWAKRTITTRVWGAGVYDPYNAAELADALIAAGVVADVQSLAEGDCVLYVKGKGFMRLYNEQDINKMIQRAEVNEKMFDILYEETSEYMKVLSKKWYKYQAEKELAEERKDV